MYQVTIKGRSLQELKIALGDFQQELCGERSVVGIVSKDMSMLEEDVLKPIEAVVHETPTSIIEEYKAPLVEAINVQSNLELDSQGIPHDIRIHAKSLAKVANGSWRTKRGADANEVAQITNELKLAYGNVPVEVPVVAAPVVAPIVIAPAPVHVPVVAAPVVEAPKVVAAPAPAPVLNVVSGHSVETFKVNYAMIISELITNGKVTQDYINQLKSHFGVAEIWDLDDAQKEQMFSSFVSFGFIQAV